MDYITSIKAELDKAMHEQCIAFTVLGVRRETPRYLNFGGFDIKTKVLRIESTQTKLIFFHIQTTFDDVDCSAFWQQFKEYRTKFLLENYPTISVY